MKPSNAAQLRNRLAQQIVLGWITLASGILLIASAFAMAIARIAELDDAHSLVTLGMLVIGIVLVVRGAGSVRGATERRRQITEREATLPRARVVD